MKVIFRTGSRFLVVMLALYLFGIDSFAQTQTEKPQIAKKGSAEPAVTEPPPEPPISSPGVNVLNRVGVDPSQTTPFTLNEAIRKALENNNQIEVAKNDVKLAETQLRSIQGSYDPVFSVSPKWSRSATTGSSSSNDFRTDSNFTKLLQKGGGNYDVFFSTSQSGSNSQNNQAFNQTSGLGGGSGTTYFSNLGVRFNQPLFRNYKVDQTRRQIKIQRKRLEQSDSDFRRQTIDVISQVQRAYWDLVFALRDQQNRVANLNLSKENLRRVEASIAAGKSAPLERAEVSTELANREAEVLVASQQVSIAENALKALILKDATSSEWTQSYVPTDTPLFTQDPISVDDAIKDAIDNRPELRRLKLQSEINKIDIDFFRNQVKPQIDLNTSLSLNGLSLGSSNVPAGTTFPLITTTTPTTNADSFLLSQINTLRAAQNLPLITANDVPRVSAGTLPGFLTGGTGRSLANLFRTDSFNYTVGVTFSFPLRNRTAKANLAGAMIQEQQIDAQMRSQEQAVVVEVRNAVQAVETARQRVLAARRGRENAEIQLNGERKLYEVGRSTTFLLFQRENALTNARNAEIRAETDYNKALSDLQRATSTTFRLNNIEVESPVKVN